MTIYPVTVLLVEDNDVDVEAVRRGFVKHKIANPIEVAGDGAEALERLRIDDGSEAIRRPVLVLLDLNLPRMNGIEFLQELRGDEVLRRTLVFVLTTSKADEDIIASYDLNVAGYIVKNNVGPGFLGLAEMLDAYWRIVEFPPEVA